MYRSFHEITIKWRSQTAIQFIILLKDKEICHYLSQQPARNTQAASRVDRIARIDDDTHDDTLVEYRGQYTANVTRTISRPLWSYTRRMLANNTMVYPISGSHSLLAPRPGILGREDTNCHLLLSGS